MIPDWFFLHKWNTRHETRQYACTDCGLVVRVRKGERWIRCRGDGWHELRRREQDREFRAVHGEPASARAKR
jgi:hypothetical protein